jgi:hypothetical protein
METLKRKIIGGPEFHQRELKVRINEEATFYISTHQLLHLDSKDVENKRNNRHRRRKGKTSYKR